MSQWVKQWKFGFCRLFRLNMFWLVVEFSVAKVSFSYLWQLLTFSFGVSSNLLQQKNPKAEIVGICIFSRDNRSKKILAYNFRCWALLLWKIWRNPKRESEQLSKVTEAYFRFKEGVFNIAYSKMKFSKCIKPKRALDWKVEYFYTVIGNRNAPFWEIRFKIAIFTPS